MTRFACRAASLAAVLALPFAGCGPGPGAGTPRAFTDAQLNAKFPYDLGADRVDVSSYPADQQQNYLVFASACSRCHTLARPINAPLVKSADWLRFVRRMHFKADQKLLTKTQAAQVVAFLAYDASVRKVAHRATYLATLRELNIRFAEVQTERARVQLEETAKMTKDRGYVSP